jgi:hypothetical protein
VCWNEDASNADHRHRRNRIRHVVLPALEADVPGTVAGLAALGERSRVAAAALEATVDAVWSSASVQDGLALDRIVGLEPVQRRQVWRRLVLQLGIACERAHLERIDRLALGAPGRRLHLGRWLLLRRGRTLAWEAALPPRHEHPVGIAGAGEYRSGAERLSCRIVPRPAQIAFAADEAWLDAASCAWPLVWRAALAVERFTPLGAPGRQTLVKYLSTRGVPSRRRPLTAVVADTQGIIWVPGFGIAERVKITDATREVVHLRRAPACGTVTPPTVPSLQGDPA